MAMKQEQAVSHLIGGQWTDLPTGNTLQSSLDPATGEVIGYYVPGTVEYADAAVAAAVFSWPV